MQMVMNAHRLPCGSGYFVAVESARLIHQLPGESVEVKACEGLTVFFEVKVLSAGVLRKIEAKVRTSRDELFVAILPIGPEFTPSK